MCPETVARLAKIKNIVGVKEASGSLQAISEIIDLCGKDFTVLSGDDPLLWPILAVGGRGVISVSANILPGKVAAMCQAAANGDMAKARSLHYEMREINDVLFIDTNPVPVKAALHLMGKIEKEVRAPLVTLSSSHLESVKEVLKKHGLC